MKRLLIFLGLISFLLVSCGPKPAYKTRKGKQKIRHSNDIMYDQKWKSNKRH